MIGIKIGAFNSMVSYGDIKNSTKKYECNVILSKNSKRVIPSLITFIPKGTFIGEEAKIYFKRFYNSSLFNISRLISLSYKTDFGKKEIDEYFKENIYNEQKNSFMIEIDKKEKLYSLDEIIYIYIKKLYEYFITSDKKKVEKIIINIPDYFTIPQIKRYRKILEKIGIKTNFLKESVAISLYYYFSRFNDLFCQGDYFKYVIFIDIGHSQTSFYFSKFNYHNCEVIKSKIIPFLGGRNIDEKLLYFLNDKFKQLNKKDFIHNKKAIVKINEDIEKIKQHLSISDDFMINIESFSENIDFICQFKNEDIKEVIKDIIEEFSFNFKQFYQDCLKELKEDEGISFIELTSDLTRIPFFESEIKNIANMPISRTISSDENVAGGNSLYCLLEEEKLPNNYIESIYKRCEYNLYYNLNNDKNDIKILNIKDKIPFFYSINIELLNTINDKINILFKYLKKDIEYFIQSEEIMKFEIKLRNIKKKFKSAIQLKINIFVNINEEIELKNIEVINQKGEIFKIDDLKEIVTESLINDSVEIDTKELIENEEKNNKKEQENEEFNKKKNNFISIVDKIKKQLTETKYNNYIYKENNTFEDFLLKIITQVNQEKNIENGEMILKNFVEDFCNNYSKITNEKKELERKMNNCIKKVENDEELKYLKKPIESLKNSLNYVIDKTELSKIEEEYNKIKKPVIDKNKLSPRK